MLLDHSKSAIVTALVSLVVCTSCALSPVHEGKYTFEGKVTDKSGKPVPDAWVKVRGWETLTDAAGKWRQEVIVECGAKSDAVAGAEEANQILVIKDGYKSVEENFIVKRPAFFVSCKPEQHLAFDTVLGAEAAEEPKKKEEQWSVPKKPKGTFL